MDKKTEIEKNKLDLMHQRHLQELNAALAFGTVGTLTIVAATLGLSGKISWTVSAVMCSIVLAISSGWYISIRGKINDIIGQIGDLSR